MSSVTFLVSAVLTICVLNAIDQNGLDVSIDKIDLSSQARIDVNKASDARLKLIKPDNAQLSVPNKSVYGASKVGNLLPTTENSNKNIAVKSASAI